MSKIYLSPDPQFGCPMEAGYYLVWSDKSMIHPVGLAHRIRGKRGGEGTLRWIDPELHEHVRWNYQSWYWTRLFVNSEL